MTTAIEKKLKAISKSCKHVVRKVSDEEAELIKRKYNLCMDLYDGRHSDWFTHGKSQVVLSKRENGQYVVFTI